MKSMNHSPVLDQHQVRILLYELCKSHYSIVIGILRLSL